MPFMTFSWNNLLKFCSTFVPELKFLTILNTNHKPQPEFLAWNANLNEKKKTFLALKTDYLAVIRCKLPN